MANPSSVVCTASPAVPNGCANPALWKLKEAHADCTLQAARVACVPGKSMSPAPLLPVPILETPILLDLLRSPGRLDPMQAMALASSRVLGTNRGIIMARFVRLRFATIPIIAAAVIASTTASGWAFSQQMLGPGDNGNYNFNYSDPAHQAATSQSTPPSDPNSQGFHFSVEGGQTGPFNGFQSGSHSFNNSGDPTSSYFHPPNAGN